MKIIKVIADEKPDVCIGCKLVTICKCGVFKDNVRTDFYMNQEWKVSANVPGPNCPIEVTR